MHATSDPAKPRRPKRGEPRPYEHDVRAAIISLLNDRGAYVEITVQTGAQRRGLSDLVGHYRGFFYRLEVKRDAYAGAHEVKPAQAIALRDVRRKGGYGEVVWSTEQVEAMLHWFDLTARAVYAAIGKPFPQSPKGIEDIHA